MEDTTGPGTSLGFTDSKAAVGSLPKGKLPTGVKSFAASPSLALKNFIHRFRPREIGCAFHRAGRFHRLYRNLLVIGPPLTSFARHTLTDTDQGAPCRTSSGHDSRAQYRQPQKRNRRLNLTPPGSLQFFFKVCLSRTRH